MASREFILARKHSALYLAAQEVVEQYDVNINSTKFHNKMSALIAATHEVELEKKYREPESESESKSNAQDHP